LKQDAYIFENCSAKYAKTLKAVFDSISPSQRHSVTALNPAALKRRQGLSQKRAAIVKTSTQAMKNMMKRLTFRNKAGATPSSIDSPASDLASSFYSLARQSSDEFIEPIEVESGMKNEAIR
jgi:hypothetical protein